MEGLRALVHRLTPLQMAFGAHSGLVCTGLAELLWNCADEQEYYMLSPQPDAWRQKRDRVVGLLRGVKTLVIKMVGWAGGGWREGRLPCIASGSCCFLGV